MNGTAKYKTGPHKRFFTVLAMRAIITAKRTSVTKAVTQWNSCTLAIPSQAAGRQEMSRDPAAAKRPNQRKGTPQD